MGRFCGTTLGARREIPVLSVVYSETLGVHDSDLPRGGSCPATGTSGTDVVNRPGSARGDRAWFVTRVRSSVASRRLRGRPEFRVPGQGHTSPSTIAVRGPLTSGPLGPSRGSFT